MADKPSCETCTIQTCRMHPTNKPELKQEGVYFIQDAFRQFGCLSHPQAREYLMKDVIEGIDTLYEIEDIDGRAHDKIRTLIKNGVDGK